MAVKYVIRDGELVSIQWAVALDEMERDIGAVHVNEGKRTLARQWYFWNCYQSKRCNNGNLAAFPSPFAPHIREGRIDHAIDFDRGAEAEAWLDRNGVAAVRNVPGENWHVEVNAAALQSFYERHSREDYETLPPHLIRAVKSYISARHQVQSRIRDRDKIHSKRNPDEWTRRDKKVKAAVRKRNRRRGALEQIIKRSKKPRTRKILRELLAHPKANT